MHFYKSPYVFYIVALIFGAAYSFGVKANQLLEIEPGLYDLSQEETLGLPQIVGAKTSVAYKAVAGKSQYNHGAVLFVFKGKLFLQWQSSAKDEDGKDTSVKISVSENGDLWSKAKTLAPARKNALVTSGGWWSDGKVLVAYLNVWPHGLTPKGGYVEYVVSKNGKHWSEPKPLLDSNGKPVDGIIEQDLKALPSGRILTALHTQPGLILKPFYTDDPRGISGWNKGVLQNLSHKEGISRELEPSWFLNSNNSVTMIFRDQGSSYKVLASESKDEGKTWSIATVSNMPDSRAKQSAGNLPSGAAYIINNPTGVKRRSPLVLTVNTTGKRFDKAFLIRGERDRPEMKYEGRFKRVGFSYPKSIVWKNAIWVSYGVNKEDIAVTKIPIASIK